MSDFVHFLTELYGHAGPSKSQLRRPESIKLTLQHYASLYQSTSKVWMQTQTMMDFQALSSKKDLGAVKRTILERSERLLEKGMYLKGLDDQDYNTLMKCLLCILVFRNGCRISTATFLQFEHDTQLCRVHNHDNLLMPLAPSCSIEKRK